MRRQFSWVALASLIPLAGCGESATFISFGGKAAGQPVFCISEQPNCAAPGASLSSFIVDEIDDTGRKIQTMWEVHPVNTLLEKQYSIEYGLPPLGWKQIISGGQLVAGHHYRVNNQYFFSITPNGLIIQEKAPAGFGL